jgi:hypothetical protein
MFYDLSSFSLFCLGGRPKMFYVLSTFSLFCLAGRPKVLSTFSLFCLAGSPGGLSSMMRLWLETTLVLLPPSTSTLLLLLLLPLSHRGRCINFATCDTEIWISAGYPQGAALPPPPIHVAKADENNLNEEITPLLPTGNGKRFSQTISNLGHAAPM